jgi:hypothetical protein
VLHREQACLGAVGRIDLAVDVLDVAARGAGVITSCTTLLIQADALRDEVTRAQALATLLVLASFHTFEELRAAGLTTTETERFAISRAQALLAARCRLSSVRRHDDAL